MLPSGRAINMVAVESIWLILAFLSYTILVYDYYCTPVPGPIGRLQVTMLSYRVIIPCYHTVLSYRITVLPCVFVLCTPSVSSHKHSWKSGGLPCWPAQGERGGEGVLS